MGEFILGLKLYFIIRNMENYLEIFSLIEDVG